MALVKCEQIQVSNIKFFKPNQQQDEKSDSEIKDDEFDVDASSNDEKMEEFFRQTVELKWKDKSEGENRHLRYTSDNLPLLKKLIGYPVELLYSKLKDFFCDHNTSHFDSILLCEHIALKGQAVYEGVIEDEEFAVAFLGEATHTW